MHIYRLKCKYLSTVSYPEGLFLSEDVNDSSEYSWTASMMMECNFLIMIIYILTNIINSIPYSKQNEI